MNALLHRYTRALATAGTIVLVAALVFDPRWIGEPLTLRDADRRRGGAPRRPNCP